jgi:ABC-type sugar transport system ATPase subunit
MDIAMAPQPLVRLTGISKSYPGVKALKGVDLDIMPGEIHCLIGENGAGKSTLMRIMAGAARPDGGVIEVGGKAYDKLDPANGIALGIGVIYQEIDLIPAMTVAENIFINNEPTRRGVVDRRTLDAQARAVLANFDVDISPRSLVRDLGPAARQLVQIAKSLSHDHKVLVLDEPTASLTDNEVEHLLALLGRFKASGMGLVYISHRLEEVLQIGDRVTVLRDGERVLTREIAGMTKDDLIEAMVGRRLTATAKSASGVRGEEALSVDRLTRQGEFSDVSFSVRKGEVLGLAGLVGAGRSELLETIFGVRAADSGAISVLGQPIRITRPADAINAGLGLVPEERRTSGVVLNRSVADNVALAMLDRLGGLFGLNRSSVREAAQTQVDNLRIRAPDLDTLVGTLSGGNQQKVVIGKWLAADVKILLLDEPTRGVDVNAKAEIYRLVDDLARSGAAVVMASSELPELLAVTDRILVLSGGRQTAVLETAKTDQVEIMRYAVPDADRPLTTNHA